MDFALLPPEVNSGRMYTGAGAGPLLAAAQAWDALAFELATMGSAYDSALAELQQGWGGPSAVRMATAAAPYAKWMHTTSAAAEHTAGQARAAAAAYEAAFAMTVPPPVIAANRVLLATLVATNFFGQNAAAIAAAEAHYAQMWAQDATAMYTYAGAATAASRLAPLSQPPRTTRDAGPAAAPPDATGNVLETIVEIVTEPTVVVDVLGVFGDALGTFGVDLAGPFGFGLAGLGEIGGELIPLAELGELGALGEFGALAGYAEPAAATAGLGEAAAVGRLSVPPAWTTNAPVLLRNAALPLAPAGTAASVGLAEAAAPMAGIAGSGAAGAAGRAGAAAGSGRTPVGKPAPVRRREAGPGELPELPELSRFGMLMGADVELRELAELRSAGILTDDEYLQQRRRLVNR